MVSWFKKKVVKWVREAHENAYANDASIKTGLAIPSTGNPINMSDGLSFTICRADGGYIVQTQYWDGRQGSNVKGSNVNSLYIITDDKNIGEELNKIFIFTNLKH